MEVYLPFENHDIKTNPSTDRPTIPTNQKTDMIIQNCSYTSNSSDRTNAATNVLRLGWYHVLFGTFGNTDNQQV